MSVEIGFSKYVAAGNDFIIIDNRNNKFNTKFIKLLAKRMCARKFSVGGDGLLVLEDSDIADIKMRVINPDASEAEMCGNGLRCISLFAKNLGLCKQNISIETSAGVMESFIDKLKVKNRFNTPEKIKLNFNLNINDSQLECSFINTGVPHVVNIVDSFDIIDIEDVGRKIRYEDKFKPNGTNVNFVKILDKNFLEVRTYERGVEKETLACGTGSVASAVISYLKNLVEVPIDVKTKSGEILTVSFKEEKSEIVDLFLEGKVEKVYNGRYEYV